MYGTKCVRQIILAVNGKFHLSGRVIILPLLLIAFLLSKNLIAQQQDQVILMDYNLLNYPDPSNSGADSALRNPFYRTTIGSVNPDILVVEEMNTQSGMNGFLSNVMNASSTTYSAGTFIDGPDTDNGIFYKTSKFHFISNTAIRTALRNISEFKLVHLLSNDTIRIYAVHLKASSGTANEALRAAEVDSLRKVTNALPAGTNFIVCGDFNIYGSTESCYQKLLQINATDEGYFIDPITMTGTWNNSAYAIHHTQSPRTRAFGGGSTGGLDDRFDLILYSKAISQTGGVTYVANSEIAYGNDGNHYNDSINHMPNTAVSVDVANALHYGSDHIPTIARFNFEYASAAPPDAGVLSLAAPTSPMCSNANQTLQVVVKNFGPDSLKFANTNLQATLSVINPSAVLQTFTKTISTGALAPNASMTVTFDNTYNMSASGNYIFNSNTVLSGDVNTSNNAMPATTVIVNSNPTAAITPAGPISFCSGSSATLTASAGTSYLWSNSAATQSIIVSTAGNYSVTVTSANGCSSTSSSVSVSIISPPPSGTLFTETMGTVTGTTAIATHETNNGFDNDNFTMSGTGDIRITSPSTGYGTGLPVASGLANVFITNTVGKNFIIADINSSGLTNLQLSFGINKNTSASNGSDLLVQVSSDGVNYTNLTVPALPTTSAGWFYVTASGTIPAVPNLRIQFKQNGTATQFRIDDVSLMYSPTLPLITAIGSTTLCQGQSVTLTTGSGTNYLWSNGATTQSITVSTAGNYSVMVDCVSSAPTTVTVNTCSVNLNLKLFISGFYSGGGNMVAVVDAVNHPTLCDTISVELHSTTSPYNLAYSVTGTISTTGNGSFVFPGAVLGNSYYIAIRHRNSMETWTKNPVLFNSSTVNFDFTTP